MYTVQVAQGGEWLGEYSKGWVTYRAASGLVIPSFSAGSSSAAAEPYAAAGSAVAGASAAAEVAHVAVYFHSS